MLLAVFCSCLRTACLNLRVESLCDLWFLRGSEPLALHAKLVQIKTPAQQRKVENSAVPAGSPLLLLQGTQATTEPSLRQPQAASHSGRQLVRAGPLATHPSPTASASLSPPPCKVESLLSPSLSRHDVLGFECLVSLHSNRHLTSLDSHLLLPSPPTTLCPPLSHLSPQPRGPPLQLQPLSRTRPPRGPRLFLRTLWRLPAPCQHHPLHPCLSPRCPSPPLRRSCPARSLTFHTVSPSMS